MIPALSAVLTSILCLSLWKADAATECYSRLDADTLTIGNSLMERKFVWNGGNLMTASITDKTSGKIHRFVSLRPDFVMTSAAGAGEDGDFVSEDVPQTPVSPAFHRVTVSFRMEGLQVRREFRIYDWCPAIACDTWLKGSLSSELASAVENNADKKNIEFAADMKSRPVSAVIDRVSLKGNHWHAKAVEFWDVTDWNDNLVAERDIISYRKNSYRGNLLFMQDGIDGSGLFFLKEAPCSSVQLEYGGADFIADFGTFSVTGPGINSRDIGPDSWTGIYSVVTGVWSGGELEALTALRKYQKNVRRHLPERDEMIMMNTWGDRSQDSKVNEEFCLAELEKASRLGITHFQIDDGWQVGKSPNSAVAKGSFKNIWDNPDYWTPDPVKYPRGLKPVVDRAKELGIEVGLWFNPSIQNDFEDWRKDADALIRLYREYGIRIFKIDGLNIPNKTAENNLRRFFDAVSEATGRQVVFNLDVTAGRRGGYHYFNEYGNIFLENRYTDWGNYYPYHTLRNVWLLSKYVPAEKLQVEFLNKWRNEDKYPEGDPFAPGNYDFAYLFAVAMPGQPLAWMEASNLPEEAFGIAPLVGDYRRIMNEFHEGVILPVGEEPSGRSWTGFQSVGADGSGYILVFREDNGRASAEIRTWLPEGADVRFEPVLASPACAVSGVASADGDADTSGAAVAAADVPAFETVPGEDGRVEFTLPAPNTFALYRYFTDPARRVQPRGEGTEK